MRRGLLGRAAEVSLTVLKQTRTPEGESFVSMQLLDVDIPAVMGGSVTITHRIDEDSPLYDCVVDGLVSPARLEQHAFSATVVANDDVYQAEINAMKRYTFEDFAFNKRFEDVRTRTQFSVQQAWIVRKTR